MYTVPAPLCQEGMAKKDLSKINNLQDAPPRQEGVAGVNGVRNACFCAVPRFLPGVCAPR